MSAFLFIKTRIHDPDAYLQYVEALGPLAAKYNTRFIARSAPIEVLEGDAAEWGNYLLLVAEFETVEAARGFWRSQDYGEVRQLRSAAGTVHVVLAEELPRDRRESVRVVPAIV